jgi:hypothetical protein
MTRFHFPFAPVVAMIVASWLAHSSFAQGELEEQNQQEPPAKVEEKKQAEKQVEQDETQEEEQAAGQDDKMINTADFVGQTAGEIGDQNIRFHLWNGLIIGGDLVVDHIDVETEFGSLKVPIRKIQRFYPGLDSFPEMQQKIEGLVEGLGDKNFEIRERSHNELVAMGPLLAREIHRFDDGGSVERKKHLGEIKRKIEELVLQENSADNQITPLIRGDKIETGQFSIVGKVLQNDFQLKSKYGDMRVLLADIQMADRTFNQVTVDVRKNVTIDGMDFFPTGTSTKIRVKQGDKINITANGTVNWINWNSSCGPEGMTDKGQFLGHQSGTLLARIGNTGDYIRIGAQGSFIAATSGELFLGIAIADNYGRNSGYRWTGEYQAKILIQPAANPAQ